MRQKLKLLSGLSAISLLVGCIVADEPLDQPAPSQADISSRSIPIIDVDRLRFRDLNRNGSLDSYEDWRLPPKERAEDLLAQMTLEERAGQIAHGNLFPNANFGEVATGYDLEQAKTALSEHEITTFIPFAALDFKVHAEQNNGLQEIAEAGRLGIPFMISTDPRHHSFDVFGQSSVGNGYSQWPETLGFAALDDADVTYRFAQIAAQEYRATGFTRALSPQADLATEPRWSRVFGTFGEDPEIAARHVSAYVRGFQGSDTGLVAGGVPTVVKHWVGYGAAKDGWDAHNYYGRFAALKSEDLPNHIVPFDAAFDAGVASVMTAYSVFEGLEVNGQPVEPVGGTFSKVLVSDLLRDEKGFDGVVLSDWAVTSDCSDACKFGRPEGAYPDPEVEASTAWGILDLTRAERFAKAMNNGVDQFGGVDDTVAILEAVTTGLISEERLDDAVLRILIQTFQTGIFDNPFIDVEAAESLVNSSDTQALALQTQARATVLLKGNPAPLNASDQPILYLHGTSSEVFEDAGYSVSDQLDEADIVLARLSTPFETLHPNYFFGMQQHEGTLAFDDGGEVVTFLNSAKDSGATVIVDVAMDRPAILTNIVDLADTLIANFGASDAALLSVLDGSVDPEGRLPFELPSSMEAVAAQDSGKIADSPNPLFELGHSAFTE